MSEPHDLTIREAAAALRDGSLTAAALTDAVLARAAATEPAINAYITLTADLARQQAASADEELRAGRDRGPLHGIPVALKDIIDTAGIPTTAGSDFLRDRVPQRDAFVTRKLYDAGAVLVGKLNLHEFAMSTTSINPYYGPVGNPWDPARVAGGSSGGSAAAVAAGSALATLGSDTGGSIRLPAALCGVVGLKPTYGRVGRSGVVMISWSLDHVGPLTRTVEDAALMLNAIAGYDPNDGGSAEDPAEDFTRDLGRGVEGLRIGIARKLFWSRCDPEIEAASAAAIDVLRGLGATVHEVDLPLLHGARRTPILAVEAAAYHSTWLRQHADRYGDDARSLLEAGALIPGTAYVQAQRLRTKIIDETRALFTEIDVLASPTSPVVAPTIEAGDPKFVLARYIMDFNVTAIPAISIPCGLSDNGLPISLMLGGRHFGESALLRAAHAYEQATDWHRRRPPL